METQRAGGSLLITLGAALLAFDIFMSLAWSGFLVPQMVLALFGVILLIAGVAIRRQSFR